MSAGLSRLADPKLWLGLVTLVVVLVMVFHETERTSPGPLTTTHARLPELSGAEGCDRCHGPDIGVAGACSTCHEAIGAQISAKTGFHGALADVDPTRCALCHREHHGDEARLVDERAFALAGVADRSAFDHGFTAFGLVGAHSGLECSKCHRDADAVEIAKGGSRFAGLEQACRSCHADPHGGRFDANCASCHGQSSFTEVTNFKHSDAFPLVGRHAGVSCESCHASDGPFAVQAVGAASYAAPPRACQDCHESPHAAPFLASVASLVKSTSSASCQECHSALDGSFDEGGARMAPALHAASGFPLLDGHASVDCAQCHSTKADSNRFQAKHPGGRSERCESCHETPHGEQFQSPKPSTCVQCHSPAKWSPSQVTVMSHPKFDLVGAHAKVSCNECHTRKTEDQPRLYRGAPRECQACHQDAHDNAFQLPLRLAASEARAAGGSCALCHTADRFDAVAADRFDHARWTKFDLAGAHARAKCDACHRASAEPDAVGRTFGRVADLFHGPVGACESCHADVHRGAFDGLAPATAIPGRCASCHGVEAFRPALASFDHATTGFALDGGHAKASCGACHGATDKKTGRTLGFVSDSHAGAPMECGACHEDVHAGAFDRSATMADAGGAVGCARCHTTDAFDSVARADFQHGAWTGYPLRGAHARAACEACHVPSSSKDQRGRRFGVVAGNDCSDCHVDVHFGQFASGGRTDCARCHDAQLPLRKVVFDHQRDSRFALDANHVKLACAACHKPWPTADGRSAIRFKPLGTECADCHGVAGKKK